MYNLPTPIKYALEKLQQSGYEAYVVGGCVRDMLLNVTPKDYDICTSATPEQTMTIFADYTCYDVGAKYGTIGVVIDKNVIEITTFRSESDYNDNRHPDSVTWTREIVVDLSRRDFTMNAIAYSPATGLIDPFGGQNDIKNECINCVGIANDRFEEDALRILRALRFSSQLGFRIDICTHLAIIEKSQLLKNIAKERVREEFIKTINGKNATSVLDRYRAVLTVIIPEIKYLFNREQKNKYHFTTVWGHTLKALEFAIAQGYDEIIKLAIFFHDIGKPVSHIRDEKGVDHFYGHSVKSAEITLSIMNCLRFSKSMINEVLLLIRYHDIKIYSDTITVKKLLHRFGETRAIQLILVQMCDSKGKNKLGQDRYYKALKITREIDRIIKNGECYSLKQLAVNGFDLAEIGYQGEQIGEMLNILLNRVIIAECINEKDVLLDYCRKGGCL